MEGGRNDRERGKRREGREGAGGREEGEVGQSTTY